MSALTLLNEKINNYIEEMKSSGCIYINYNNVRLEKCFGENVNYNSNIIFRVDTPLLVKLVLFDIINDNKSILNDSITKYFPSINHEFTVLDVLVGRTGLSNYLYSVDMNSEESLNSNNDDFFINNQLDSMKQFTIDKLIEYINGVKYNNIQIKCNNHTNTLLGMYLVEAITNKKFIDLLAIYINKLTDKDIIINKGLKSDLKWYGSYRRDKRFEINIYDNNINEDLYFSISINDYLLFVKSLYDNVFKTKLWKKYSFYDKKCDNVISKNNELNIINLEFISSVENRICYDIDKDLLFVSIYNDKGFGRYFNGFYEGLTTHVDRELRRYYVQKTNPKFVKANEKMIFDLMRLELLDEQRAFVMESRNLICNAFARKHKIYALYDMGLAIGFVTLIINKKTNRYFINSLMIDEKYQNKGYGKVILNETFKFFKKLKANKVGIGVRKENKVAYNLYVKLGFKVIEQDLLTYYFEKDLTNYEE